MRAGHQPVQYPNRSFCVHQPSMSCGWLWGHVMRCHVVVWCCELGDDVLWTLRREHDSKTLQRSIPLRGETLGCKTHKNFGERMSQYYGSVLQSTTPYYTVTTTFMFGSRNTWNIQYIARSDLWDATTTASFGLPPHTSSRCARANCRKGCSSALRVRCDAWKKRVRARLLYCQLLYSQLLLLSATLLLATPLSATLLSATLTLSYSTLSYSTLSYSTLSYSTLSYSTLSYSYSQLLYS